MDERGTCKYCGCTEDHACEGGCYWANSAETVCSNPECLEKEQAAGNIHMDEDYLEDDLDDSPDLEAEELEG